MIMRRRAFARRPGNGEDRQIVVGFFVEDMDAISLFGVVRVMILPQPFPISRKAQDEWSKTFDDLRFFRCVGNGPSKIVNEGAKPVTRLAHPSRPGEL